METHEAYRKIQAQLGGLFGNGHRHSLPIPTRAGSGVVLSVFLAPQVVAGEGTKVFPPSHVAQFGIGDGELIEMRSAGPSFFGRQDAPGEELGFAVLPDGVTFDDYMRMRLELFEAYDRLVPAFRKSKRSLSGRDADAAEVFRARFPLLRESVLEPYYEALGRDFFGWLDQAGSRR